MGSPPSRALDEIPLEIIKEKAEQFPEVKIHPRRQTPKGTWASMPTIVYETAALVSIHEWLRDNFGGGRYRIQCQDPQNELNEVIPPFRVEVEGAPKQSQAATLRQLQGPQTRPFTAGAHPLGWNQRMMQLRAPAMAAASGSELEEVLPHLVSQPSDAVAMEQVHELREQLRELNSKYDAEKRANDEKIERARELQHTLEKKALEEERRHEREMLNLRIDLQSKTIPQKAPIDYVALTIGLVPVFTALITSSKDRQALQLQMQQQQATQQTESIKAFLAVDKGKGASGAIELVKVALPVIMPLVTAFMNDKSPSAIAKLVGAMSEGQLQTISIVSQLMQQMAKDDDNPWMDVARQAIQGVQAVAEQMVDVTQRKQQAPQPQQLNGGNGQHPPAGTLTAASTPDEIADAIVSAPQVPADFKSPEWRAIFKLIHDGTISPHVTAVAISQHLETLYDAHKLPSMFAKVLDNDGPKPSSVLKPLLEELPVAQFLPARVTAICAEFDKVLGDEPPQAEANA